MAKIDYVNKTQTAGYDASKWNSQDANEVKTSVNALYDNGAGVRKIITRVYQTGTEAPTSDLSNRYLDTLSFGNDPYNPDYASIFFERTDVGTYKLNIETNASGNLINTSKVDLTFGDKILAKGSVYSSTVGILQTTTIIFYTYNYEGVLADNVLNTHTTFFLTIYD